MIPTSVGSVHSPTPAPDLDLADKPTYVGSVRCMRLRNGEAGTGVGPHSPRRIEVLPPASLQNSHQNGGRIFLISVANQKTVRLYPMWGTFLVPDAAAYASREGKQWDWLRRSRGVPNDVSYGSGVSNVE